MQLPRQFNVDMQITIIVKYLFACRENGEGNNWVLEKKNYIRKCKLGSWATYFVAISFKARTHVMPDPQETQQ